SPCGRSPTSTAGEAEGGPVTVATLVWEDLRTDVLVVGGALAALRAAIAAREQGADVLLVSRGVAGRSGSTVIASAGIAAYIPDPDIPDSPQLHWEDTMRSSQGL